MSAKTERNCLILRVDSQYCSTLPQKVEIFIIHSQESPKEIIIRHIIQRPELRSASLILSGDLPKWIIKFDEIDG